MTRAYDRAYVGDAMTVLAEFFDYGVNDYGVEGDEVADLFCMSELSARFADGHPSVVGGMSGSELFCRLAEKCGSAEGTFPKPVVRYSRTPEYWVGWAAAYAQWRLDISFDLLFSVVPYDDFRALYYPWHEVGEERFARLVAERALAAPRPTALARLRKQLGLTQRELAYRSGVALRSIQVYEQREKDINSAKASSLAALARELHCSMEDLLEPVFTLDEDAA